MTMIPPTCLNLLPTMRVDCILPYVQGPRRPRRQTLHRRVGQRCLGFGKHAWLQTLGVGIPLVQTTREFHVQRRDGRNGVFRVEDSEKGDSRHEHMISKFQISNARLPKRHDKNGNVGKQVANVAGGNDGKRAAQGMPLKQQSGRAGLAHQLPHGRKDFPANLVHARVDLDIGVLLIKRQLNGVLLLEAHVFLPVADGARGSKRETKRF